MSWKRYTRWLVILLLAPTALFLLSAWIGSSIPRNGGWAEPGIDAADSITLLIGDNGVHTEIIMPIETDIIDWRDTFPPSDLRYADPEYTHVGVSWGERSFFLETPTWGDLNLLTAANALTGGDGLIHAAYYVRPAPAEDFRKLRIRRGEYRVLAHSIGHQLASPETRTTYPGYADHDAFYDASGTYHLGNTCNQWTSDQLAGAGVETGWWTPLSGGVMKWVPAFEGR